MSQEPLVVVGLGADGPGSLGSEARAHVAKAQVLAGGQRHLAFFASHPADKLVIRSNIESLVGQLKERQRTAKIVVLASGDPLFYGIGRALLSAFPADQVVFLPHVSAVQLAFARIKEPWDDACTVSLHGRPLERLMPALQSGAARIAVLTDAVSQPSAIASFLLDAGFGDAYHFWVCENLGAPEECVTHWAPVQVPGAAFAPLNIVLLIAQATERNVRRWPLLGIPEQALQHRAVGRGLITKTEVRLLALAALELQPGDVFWDVGAGSGSVSLEAARLTPYLRVWAIERDPEMQQMLQENGRSFGLANVSVIADEAPAAFVTLPDPNAVFVGGSGGRLAEILASACDRLLRGGRLVVSCITLQTFSAGWQWLEGHGLAPEATTVQITHSRPLGARACLEPEHPITLLRATKP
jgi:precorrin-6Y C5,15-methyltransferase (decarboxylating)